MNQNDKTNQKDDQNKKGQKEQQSSDSIYQDICKVIDSFQNTNVKRFSSFFFTLNPYEYVTLGFIIGLLIAPSLENQEQDSFGNWLMIIGQALVVIASQTKVISPDTVNEQEFNEYKLQIHNQLKAIINNICENKESSKKS